LQRHLDAEHAGAGGTPVRALEFQREVNRLGIGARGVYQGHRERLMRLVTAAERGEGLCVLGAGNGDDLDLPLLTRSFGDVHLVDIDEDALARAVAGLPVAVQSHVTLHRMDLSGCLSQIDAWGDRLPEDGALARYLATAAAEIARTIGRTFDVVLSACLLSQLCHPFQNTLALTAAGWRRLFGAVTRLHLSSMALLTRPGGTGVVACDVLCHGGAAIEDLRARVPAERLGEALIRAVEAGKIPADPDPRALARLLESEPGVDRTFVTEPWPWDLGATMQVVYGVVFRRA
jgi:hypothetical protein